MTDRLIKMKRSSVVSKRILPSELSDGELFVNNNSVEPGLFFKDNANPTPKLRKVGSAHVGTLPPNNNPPAGFTTEVSEGELWYVTEPTDPNYQNLLIYVAGSWEPVVSFVEQL